MSRNRFYLRHVLRKFALLLLVVAPGDDRAIGLQGKAVFLTRGNGHDVAQSLGHGGLPESVAAPGDDRAVILEGEAVLEAGGDGDDAEEVGRDGSLTEVISAPGPDA